MFGDANSTGAFGGPQLVALAVLSFSIAVTLALYLLGLPIELSGVAFVVILAGSMVLARPLFRRYRPRFEHVDEE